MASHSSPQSSKRPRQDLQSPESAPARKTPRSHPKATSTSTSTSATDHCDADTTMGNADDSVLYESSAPAPPPQHHHTHPVSGARPTQGELYGTAARAQTLATAFNNGRASTPPSQSTAHWTNAPGAPASRPSANTLVNTGGIGGGMFRPAGTRNNAPVESPATSRTRGRRPSAADSEMGNSSRRSSHASLSPTHHHTHRTYGNNPLTSPSNLRRLALTLQQAQSLSVARTPSTLANRMTGPIFGITTTTSPAPRPAAYVSHRATFLGASTDPGVAFGNRGGAGFELDRGTVSYYRHPTAESEEETILERPPTRRGLGTSQDLLRAQEAVRRQKEEDADDELAGNDGEDDEDEDEDDDEDGMDLN